MASSTSSNLAVEQRPPLACATCCHYCQHVAPPPPPSKAPPKQSADIHALFIAAVIALSTLLMFGTANATFPTRAEIEGDIRESLLPYDSP